MTRTNLRNYQSLIVTELGSDKNGIVVLPTGSGKTLIAAALAQHHLLAQSRVLFLVPTVGTRNALVQNSLIIPVPVKTAFSSKFMERVQRYSEFHYIVCAVLDPRVFGAGLTRGGITNARHKAFELVQRHFDRDADASEFICSFNDYTNKDGEFANENVWSEALIGNPLLFWGDFYYPQSPNQFTAHEHPLWC